MSLSETNILFFIEICSPIVTFSLEASVFFHAMYQEYIETESKYRTFPHNTHLFSIIF